MNKSQLSKASFSLLVISFVFGNCTSPGQGDEVVGAIETIEFLRKPQEDYFPWAQLIDSVGVIPLETTDNSLIGEISKIQILSDRIVILDVPQHNVLLFNHDGKFVNKLSVGEGPAEVYEPRDFLVDSENRLQVLSYGEIVIFDLNGTFLTKKQFNYLDHEFFMNPLQFAVAEEGKYFFWNGTFAIDDPTKVEAFLLYKTNSDLTDVSGKYFKADRNVLEYDRFRPQGGSILLSPRLMGDTIYALTSAGTVKSAYHVNFGDEALSAHSNLFSSKGESRIYWEMGQPGLPTLCGNMSDLCMTDDYVIFINNCAQYKHQTLYKKSSKTAISGQAYGFDQIVKTVRVMNTFKNRIVFPYQASELTTAWNDYTHSSQKEVPSYQKTILEATKTLSSTANPVVCVGRLKL